MRRADVYAVNSVRKALDLLKCFSLNTPEWPLSGLSRKLEIPKCTAHNLLRTLQAFDLVRQDRVSRVYRLGPRTLELGLLFARNTEIMAPARAVLRRIADGACHIGQARA
jgi:DNA-binding IclR family transcriptional regulator